MNAVDVAVVGAGIVGSACAWALSRAGLSVAVFDPRPAGATTAAGMGHVLVADDTSDALALTRRGRALWESLRSVLPAAAQWDEAGTLWVATNDEELEHARRIARARPMETEVLSAAQTRRTEPALAVDALGALFVPGDRTIYPPAAAAWLLDRARDRGATVVYERVATLESRRLTTRAGSRVHADTIVLATGCDPTLLPRELGDALRPRKGHLAITRAYPGFLHHHVAELGYFASTSPTRTESIAFNVQPRTTGQVLIGASRQLGTVERGVDRDVVARMLSRAVRFMPGLASLDILRVWTGFRPATADKRPLIGAVADRPGLHVAIGHEGLGITTALVTAELIAGAITGSPVLVDPAPYDPNRVLDETTRWRTSA